MVGWRRSSWPASVQPDVVLMDLVMPELDGVAAIALIKRDHPEVRIIALTTFAESELVLGAVQAGADGYLLKDIDVQELAHAIQVVHSGQPYLHPAATRQLLQATARPERPVERLTSREQSSAGAGGAWADQPPDRRCAGDQRENRQRACQQSAEQDRAGQPDAGRAVRGPDWSGAAGRSGLAAHTTSLGAL